MPNAAKYSLTTLVGCLLCIFCFGQSVNLEGLDHHPGYLAINGNAEKLKSNSIISLDSVLKPASQKRFQSLKHRAVIFNGYDPYYYWFRFSLKNTDSVPKEVILLFGGKGVRSAELWQHDKGNWYSLGKTGYKYPFASRPYSFAQYCYPVSIPPRTTSTFYLDIDESHSYKTFVLLLFRPDAMEKFKHRFYYFFGIFTGLLFLFAVFNLYLFFSIKEPIHIWYSLYILSALMFVIKHEGLDSQFLGLDSELGYRATYMAIFSTMGTGFLVHMVQLFLINIRRKSILGYALSIIKWWLWVAAATSFFVFLLQPVNAIEVIVFIFSNTAIKAGFIIIMCSCIYSLVKGYKPALILFLGLFAFLIGGLARAFFVSHISHVIPPAPFQIGLLAEVFIISFGLMYRYNLFKKEKDQLVIQLKEQQLNASMQMLNMQENERKRIAEDLHDGLGGDLAAIKMAFQSFQLPHQQSEMIKQLIDQASANTRGIAHNLMPPDFEKTSLAELLQNYYQRQNTEGNIRFYFYSSGIVHTFDKQAELMIYRILMELTNNIYKHSNATEATIQLVYYDAYLELAAEDNGHGFSDPLTDGIGLKNIRSRVDYLSGYMNIDTNPNGTTIMIRIPYKKNYDVNQDYHS